MIPPISPAILAANPQFATLHDHLTKQTLTQSGSSKTLASQHASTQEQLQQYHVQAAKEELLKQSLRDLVGREALPQDLRELVFVIATYLSEAPSMKLSREAHDLMDPEIAAFQDNLPMIAPLLSTHLQHQRDILLALVTVDTERPKSTTLQSEITHRFTTLAQARTTTSATALINTLSTYLTTHTALLTAHIRHLELYSHGTSARHTAARATHLSTVAAGLEAKLRVTRAQTSLAVYSPEVQRALGNYAKHLAEVRARLEERKRQLEEVRGEYDGIEGIMECARRYAGVVETVGRVREEIARLDGIRGTGGRSGMASVRR